MRFITHMHRPYAFAASFFRRKGFYGVCFFILIVGSTVTFASDAAVTYPHIKKVTTKKGYNAWLIENHTLPIVNLRFTFRNAGSAYDPEDKQGLAYMVARMLQEGAGDLASLAFKKRLEALAVDLDTDIDDDYFYISIRVLKENLPKVFELLNLMLTRPMFHPEDLKRIRTETILSLAKEKEIPDRIATKAWNKIAFEKHPYSYEEKGTEKTLAALTREDMMHFVKQHINISGSNILISAAGDSTTHDLASLLDEHLTLPEHPGNGQAALPEYAGLERARTETVFHPAGQTIIVFGQRGLKYDHPDYYAAHVLNYILGGGGFQSRMVTEIREKRGLAYTIYTDLIPLAHAAVVQGYIATRHEEAKIALELIKEEIHRIKQDGITAEELKAAKEYLIGSYPLRMTSSSKLVNMMDFIQRNRLGSDFMERRNALVDAVTTGDVNRVAKTLLEPDKLVTVIVGQ